MNSLRLEKGYRAWGADLTTERTPLESGLSCFVKTESRDFIGRKRMLSRERDPDHWSLHLLGLDDTGLDPFYAHAVLDGDEPVGMVTSGGYGHGVGRPLALAWFRKPPSDPDSIDTLIVGERVPSRILKEIPYDPDNSRLKG